MDGALGVGDRLPPLSLPRARDGVQVAWRAPARGSLVVVFPADVVNGESYLGGLAAEESELRVWDGRLLVVLPAGVEPSAVVPIDASDALTILIDTDGDARRRCGVAEGEAAVFIADRWGQIYRVVRAAKDDGLPPPREIRDWLRFLATQCPECGVPDEPVRREGST